MPLALAICKWCDNGRWIVIFIAAMSPWCIASGTFHALHENRRNRKTNQRKLKLVISSLRECIHCRGRTSGGGDIVVGVGHCFDLLWSFSVRGKGSTCFLSKMPLNLHLPPSHPVHFSCFPFFVFLFFSVTNKVKKTKRKTEKKNECRLSTAKKP